MKLPRILRVVLVGSLILNVCLAYWMCNSESRNRQALAYPTERVAYRLTNMTRFADGVSETEWADVGTRTWIYDSITEIIDYGYAAERIPTRGEPSEFSRKLGELARRVELYRDDAHSLAFDVTSNSLEARAKIQELARDIREAGWGAPAGAGKPEAWTYGRDWTELNRALDHLLAVK
jgi:hypothetical protein